MGSEENILGYEKISKLILKFSVPCIISMVVNSLYNMVDQIFIGWGVGYLGNGATNIVFPITVLCMAFALMIGDGTSAYLSLKLGEKKQKEASKGVANGLMSSIIISILFFVGILIFLPQLLNLFGCTDLLRPYALGYGKYITMGVPFLIIGTSLNAVIRADGSPKYSMISMIIGAVLNIILDPIFIFVFKMGVEGAAIATAISQFVTFLINILYIKKFKSIRISKEDLKLEFKIIKRIAALGISSFITQINIVILIAVQNNLLTKYGALTKYGQEIPVTVLGIVMKINQILTSIILGVAVGAQPIFGYNYGAKKYDRVKDALKAVLKIGLSVGAVAFILFQTIPDKLIMVFGSGDENYIEFACKTFRTYLLFVVCIGLQIPSGIFFQAIGKSTKSSILSLSRQILLLIPAFFILSSIFGLDGILYAGPVADGLAFVLASAFLFFEVKNMGKEKVEPSRALLDDNKKNKKFKKNIVITVSREYGSGGRYVGKLISDILGIKFYDKEIITKLAKETGLSEEYIEKNEEAKPVLDILNNGYNTEYIDELFIKESELIKDLAEKESCVIIGRCADFVLKDNKDVFKVFIYSDTKGKIARAKEYYGLSEEKAEKEVKRINKLRVNHYKHYTGREWLNYENYDLSINSDTLGVEKTAKFISELVKEKIK